MQTHNICMYLLWDYVELQFRVFSDDLANPKIELNLVPNQL